MAPHQVLFEQHAQRIVDLAFYWRLSAILPSLVMHFAIASHPAFAYQFHIKVDGEDASALQSAVIQARKHRSTAPDDTIVVDLPPLIVLDRTVTISGSESGTLTAPLIFRGPTTITGASSLPEVPRDESSERIIARMPATIRADVRVFSFADFGSAVRPAFLPYSTFKPTSPGKLFVFEGEKRLYPARWPDQGYRQSPTVVPSGLADQLTISVNDAPGGLAEESNAWIDGYWGWNWWFERIAVKSFDGGRLSMARPEAPIHGTARFAVSNVAARLDGPGKIYVDDAAGRVYLVPGSSRAPVPAVAVVDTLLRINHAEHIHFEHIAFKFSVGAAVVANGASHLNFDDCLFAHTGTYGLVVDGGNDNKIERCVVDDTGYAGINIAGGSTTTLQEAGDLIHSCKINRFGAVLPSYQPGIRIAGVGITVTGNEIADGPHAGIIFSGNEHKMIGNILHHVVTDSSDAGAIYSGRNWASRGNIIASNYIYDITNHVDPSLVRGIYLDDQLSGTTIFQNVFVNVDEPVLIGGGRDNKIQGNLSMRSRGSPIRIDQRGLNWQSAMAKPAGVLWASINNLSPDQRELYGSRYSGFSSTLTDRPGAPIANSFINNIADRQPVVDYEAPAIARLGIETGSRRADVDANAFPASATFLAPGDPERAGLEDTRRIILDTLDQLRTVQSSEKTLP